MHNLQLTEDHELVVDTVRKFVAEAVAPRVQHADEHREFARTWFDALAELGVYGLVVAEDRGGAGLGFLPYVAALEVVGSTGGSLARLWIGQTQAALACERAGAGPLDEAIAGSSLFSFVGSEHGFVFRDGLSGSAGLVTGAASADRVIVAARDGDAPVLVLADARALARTALEPLGLASAGCARLAAAGAGGEQLATGAAAAAAIARADLAGWLGVAAAAVGAADAAIGLAHKHAGERIAFGKPLLAQGAVKRKLVECRRAVAAARQLTWHAARLADLAQDATEAALQARIAAVDAMVLAADEAIQIHGGFGYTVEYHVERHYRDAKTFEVLDGGSEAMRDRLAAVQFV